jgi:hypothetical protein
MAAGLLAVLFSMLLVTFAAIFAGMRLRYRLRMRRGHMRPGFYPELAALGNALHRLQITAVPQIAHVMQELEEVEDEIESGDADEEAAARNHILEQAKRLRRGERIDRITALYLSRE